MGSNHPFDLILPENEPYTDPDFQENPFINHAELLLGDPISNMVRIVVQSICSTPSDHGERLI